MPADKVSEAATRYKASAAPGGASSSHGKLSDDQKNQAINEIVKTVRAQADRPNVSESFVAETKEALTQYPEPLLHLLWKKGNAHQVTPTMMIMSPHCLQASKSDTKMAALSRTVRVSSTVMTLSYANMNSLATQMKSKSALDQWVHSDMNWVMP